MFEHVTIEITESAASEPQLAESLITPTFLCSNPLCGAELLFEDPIFTELPPLTCDCGSTFTTLGWPDWAQDQPLLLS